MGRNVTSVGRTLTEVETRKKEGQRELKKHAATIHCSNSLSLLQRKISNALLYHAYKELMHKEEHEISVKQLCRLIGYQGNNHAAIKEALKGLISTIIEWNLISDETGQENWTASSIIASVSLQGPICYYAYSPRMKQLLYSPSMFGKIDLVIQSHFRSSYGLALYENCIRYRGLPQTKWIDIATFKKLMGVPPGMYDVFRDFKRRVLDKAVDEVNTYSDLIIAADYIREGRKVVKVRFSLKERAKKMWLGTKKNQGRKKIAEVDEFKLKLGEAFHLSEEQIEQLLTEYDAEFVKEKVAVIEASKPYREGKVKNLAGYLMSALKNNYQVPKTQTTQKAAKLTSALELEWADLKHEIESVRAAYQAYREETIYHMIQTLTPKQHQHLMTQFLEYAEPVIQTILQLQRNKYSRTNILESPQLKALLRQYALRELDCLSLISLEEFVAALNEEKRQAWQKLKSFDPDHPLLHFNEQPCLVS